MLAAELSIKKLIDVITPTAQAQSIQLSLVNKDGVSLFPPCVRIDVVSIENWNEGIEKTDMGYSIRIKDTGYKKPYQAEKPKMK